MRKAEVFFGTRICGLLKEDEASFSFAYDPAYLSLPDARPISLTMPLRKEEYRSRILFPFFDGLIPEGYLLRIAVRKTGLSPYDRMGVLLAVGEDTVGAVSLREISE